MRGKQGEEGKPDGGWKSKKTEKTRKKRGADRQRGNKTLQGLFNEWPQPQKMTFPPVKIISLFLPSHAPRLKLMDNFMGLKSRCEMVLCCFKITNAWSSNPLVPVRLHFCKMVSIKILWLTFYPHLQCSISFLYNLSQINSCRLLFVALQIPWGFGKFPITSSSVAPLLWKLFNENVFATRDGQKKKLSWCF